MLSVITTLEFFQHYLRRWVTGTPPVTHIYIKPSSNQCSLPHAKRPPHERLRPNALIRKVKCSSHLWSRGVTRWLVQPIRGRLFRLSVLTSCTCFRLHTPLIEPDVRISRFRSRERVTMSPTGECASAW